MIPVTKTKDKEEIKVKNEFKQGIDYEENIWKPIRMKYAFSDDVNESDKDYLSNLGDILASYFSRFIYI